MHALSTSPIEDTTGTTLTIEDAPPPHLGRTARIVGDFESVDTEQMPHQRNARGELGRPLFNWYTNTVTKDPLGRISSGVHFAEPNNVLYTALRAKGGGINPERVEVGDPAAMSRHLKRVAVALGIKVFGIARTDPRFLYVGKRYVQDMSAGEASAAESPREMAQRLPFLITIAEPWDYELAKAHRHHIGDAAYHFSQIRLHMQLKTLEGYVRELGYQAVRGVAIGQAAALAAGLGELGRNGLIINERYGARVNLNDPILTDLPLEPDEPVDFGVDDFCAVCRKCAATCPTNSISFEGKTVHNGVEKYKINWETCYRLRPLVSEEWQACLTCSTVCPFTKPDTWWRRAATTVLKTTPVRARRALVRALLWADDRFWGTDPRKRVRWLGYDSGHKPGEKGCTVAGCTASHEVAAAPIAFDDVGYYTPLKENANRFKRRPVAR